VNEAAATVFVIDDDSSVREALDNLLLSVGLKVQLFATVQEFLATWRRAGPACLVLDIRLPGQSGLDFQDDLARMKVQLPVIFITGHGDVQMSVRAMKAGAVDFLTKPFRDQDLLDAIQAALARDRAILEAERTLADLRTNWARLTVREREVMRNVVSGQSNKQIAGALSLSEPTIKTHRGQVMRKMDARSIVDLVRMADRLEGARTES
jgi:FixJ family two-component response regulator